MERRARSARNIGCFIRYKHLATFGQHQRSNEGAYSLFCNFSPTASAIKHIWNKYRFNWEYEAYIQSGTSTKNTLKYLRKWNYGWLNNK